jgi:putative phosphoribosyl transferase
MIFTDRKDAGKQLANALSKYNEMEKGLVIALPRGGVPIGYEVAKKLHLPLDIVCPRKIGAPMNKEFAIGAITETGNGILDESTIHQLEISETYLKEECEQEAKEALRRINAYRKGLPERAIANRSIILVDDGLATGSTMKAAIHSLKEQGAHAIIVAVPVAPSDTVQEIGAIVDEVICLATPYPFHAIGQFYENFSSTADEEVIRLLKQGSNL